MDTGKINPKTLTRLSELLPGATPAGAYAMGFICAANWAADPTKEITEDVLAAAKQCSSLEEALEILSYGTDD